MNPETRKRVIVLLLVLLLIGVIGGLAIRPTVAAHSDSKRNTVANANTLGVYPDGSIDMVGLLDADFALVSTDSKAV